MNSNYISCQTIGLTELSLRLNQKVRSNSYTHILNSTKRIKYCLKIEKELYTIKIFRYMKVILETLNVKINIIICINTWL